jgi:hypothetical protein
VATKTVTVQKARAGRTRVQVGARRFDIGVPVRDVPEEVIETLKAMPDVRVHVAPGPEKPTSQTQTQKPGGPSA